MEEKSREEYTWFTLIKVNDLNALRVEQLII